ncbi:MAG TPA: nucleotidyltransferase family protein, partial [Thermoanaerobaculia bacterium]|nr:nucleotidyltransferase family protein [Thermoanaerobaculia bacterium]
MTAAGMILAAGYGTRLRPITYLLPKPMVPVCNRPLIAYAVEQYLRAGIGEIVVNLHHLPEPIEQFLADGFDARFHFSREPEILGTGGGVRKVRALLEGGDDFFLVNADTIQFPDYEALRSARGDALAALTLRHPPAGDRFTPVYFDDGRITGFGKGEGEALMFAGSHCISSRVFRWIPEKEFSGIVDEAYEPAMTNGERVAGVVDDDPRWFDIGTPQRYTAASRSVLDLTLAGSL